MKTLAAKRSIQARILMSAAVLLLLLLGSLYLVVQRYSERAADEAYDRVLGAAALSIADTVEIQGADVIVDIPYAAFSILATSRLNRVFYRVVSHDGSLVTGSPTLALEVVSAKNSQLRYFDSVYQGVPVRVAAVGRFREGVGGGGWVDIIVAETREARGLLSDQLAVNALLPTFAVAVLSYLLILIAVRWAFVPLRSIEAQVRTRVASDLSPITGSIPAEAQQLVGALNEFMVRLDSTLSGLKRVTGDAAHQLRTPLAALRALTEVTLDDVPEGPLKRRLGRIHHNAVGASVLASQLLSDATVLHALETKVHERVDMCAVMAEAARRAEQEFGPKGAGRLRLVATAKPAVVVGDPLALREMMKNLIENALLYSTGPIDLQLQANAEQVRAIVADRGPGISDDLKAQMFGRFVRGDVTQTGSGLGLSIARSVATALRGQLELKDRPDGGLLAEATFPAATRASKKAEPVAMLILVVLLMSPLLGPSGAQAQSRTAVTLASTVPIEQIQPLIDRLEMQDPSHSITYRQMRPNQAVASLLASSTTAPPDLVLLPTPDLAVYLANEGRLRQLAAVTPRTTEPGVEHPQHWRSEVFTISQDPAVFVIRSEAFADGDEPRSRLDLARRLEQVESRFDRRVGLVNIGIDAVGYGLAAQDELRSPLFWRIASAFGASQVRIYDSTAELTDALARGAIDIGYNVPMTEARAAIDAGAGIEVIVPVDYVIFLPWTAFVPGAAANPAAAEKVLELILSDAGQQALQDSYMAVDESVLTEMSAQLVALNPALLVYQDPLKKSRLLDTWFQLVTKP